MFLKTCLFFLLIWNYELNEHLTLFPVLVTGTNGLIYITLNHYIKLSLKQIFSWGVTRSSSCVRGQDQNLQSMGVAIKMLASFKGLGCQLEDRVFYYRMGWVYINVLIEKSRLWRWSKKEWGAEGPCGNSWWVFFNGGGKCLSIFVNVLKNVISSQGLSAGLWSWHTGGW